MNTETIVAPATPYGIGGIAVVRLDGSQSLAIASKLLNNNSLTLIPRRATFAVLHDENGQVIDESILTFFKAPGSYTGNDLIEISCHGNPILVEKIVSTSCNYGARIADPGEFTKRAFINGKLDLLQAESVSSLIHAKSAEGSRLNLRLLSGVLSEKFNSIKNELMRAISMVEFELDISEDELQPNLNGQVLKIVQTQIETIKELLDSHKQARMLSSGATVVITGLPNVGKSTLLNTLTETDRAITHSSPGTTRDAINVPLLIDGVPINMIDTAGVRKATGDIEQAGINKAKNYLQAADLIIIVHDVESDKSQQITFPSNVPVVELVNKVDLLSNSELVQKNPAQLFISAKTGYNILKLRQQIKLKLGITGSLSDSVSITTLRQQRALRLCLDRLSNSVELLQNSIIAYEIISIELRDALSAIDTILGKTTSENILNNIFNQFCVGK